MSVVIVSRTRMRGGRVCVGAHDLADFRGLRLYKQDGTYLDDTDKVAVGQVWDLDYRAKSSLEPPHLEDVIVVGGSSRPVGAEHDLRELILRRDQIWERSDDVFDGTLRVTGGGSAYVPADGRLPNRSTGYWLIEEPLSRHETDRGTRYRREAAGIEWIKYVGFDDPPDLIPAGTLTRVSLSRQFAPNSQHEGYWLQLSGWY